MTRANLLPSCAPVLRTFVVLGAFAACVDIASSPTSTASNAPVVVNVTNAFTYVMMANGYTASVSYDLTFTTDSLAYTLVVANWGAGNATFAVGDASANTIVRDSVFTSKVRTVVQSGKGIPRRFMLGFQNFTGRISLALAANQARH